MFPISDENPTHNFPLLTIGFIAINVLVFFQEVVGPADMASVFNTYGLIPYKLTNAPIQNYPNFFTSMFLHGGFMHLAGNMLYLWIFGNNIEDVLGKVRFVMFYFLCGIVAALSHVFADVNSQVPMVGASGAISGILGAYLILFPKAKVKTLVFLGIIFTIARIPAVVFLLIWIGMQILNNMAGGEGVAWLAHIGGFIAGAVFILPFKSRRRKIPPGF